ncbi:hypothetical protein GGTG_06625 [Gaeumannomyces tritici R3-111a-1]|uniref:Uncharacterized protein n=1 Tax=Gaeumannomyces tritici (strain R3-111a-1) TaxID=644352 RepID=J3NZC6_GAET3|nr:hypothetical protein GGTG_06625 [Gaeumannomyces tritici R3-111a-1]EJT76709.1 hypothetical protein GGTG_06625 [Gaeumannomyces tritici R3-111a-1]
MRNFGLNNCRKYLVNCFNFIGFLCFIGSLTVWCGAKRFTTHWLLRFIRFGVLIKTGLTNSGCLPVLDPYALKHVKQQFVSKLAAGYCWRWVIYLGRFVFLIFAFLINRFFYHFKIVKFICFNC